MNIFQLKLITVCPDILRKPHEYSFQSEENFNNTEVLSVILKSLILSHATAVVKPAINEIN